MKLDADNQREQRQAELDNFIEATKPTPTWEQSPSEIGSEIANKFFPVASLANANLRRQIIEAIEKEREVTKHYMTQMGRWWESGRIKRRGI